MSDQRPTLLPREGEPELFKAPWPQVGAQNCGQQGLAFSMMVYLWSLTWVLEARMKEGPQLVLRMGKQHPGQEAAVAKMVRTDVFSVGRFKRKPFRGQVISLELSWFPV